MHCRGARDIGLRYGFRGRSSCQQNLRLFLNGKTPTFTI